MGRDGNRANKDISPEDIPTLSHVDRVVLNYIMEGLEMATLHVLIIFLANPYLETSLDIFKHL